MRSAFDLETSLLLVLLPRLPSMPLTMQAGVRRCTAAHAQGSSSKSESRGIPGRCSRASLYQRGIFAVLLYIFHRRSCTASDPKQLTS
ncbi:hypothetical protein SKAU_G00346650 [Synaphobranchus kaupii]|uniref:Secreted protein n=1 Tax=Synaphobranchus kaupii TaxID=118154 RepID=A0A9Q1EJN8_SYNKA|nr:hypothetical protein SKAU_G00346650 [Synaphobranchus kaupii]